MFSCDLVLTLGGPEPTLAPARPIGRSGGAVGLEL